MLDSEPVWLITAVEQTSAILVTVAKPSSRRYGVRHSAFPIAVCGWSRVTDPSASGEHRPVAGGAAILPCVGLLNCLIAPVLVRHWIDRHVEGHGLGNGLSDFRVFTPEAVATRDGSLPAELIDGYRLCELIHPYRTMNALNTIRSID